MASLLRRAAIRPLIHIQKSLKLRSALYIARGFADDATTTGSKPPVATPVMEMDKEKEGASTALEQVEEFEMPPIRPTYQVCDANAHRL